MDKETTRTMEQIGSECAEACLAVAGSQPWDDDGCSLLPHVPQPGDEIYLADTLGREATAEEEADFEAAYRARMMRDPRAWNR